MHPQSYTFSNLIDRNSIIYKNLPAFTVDDNSISHSEYANRVGLLSQGFLDLGVKQGDRIATLLLNSLELIEIIGAASYIGAIIVPLNWRLTQNELNFIIEDVAPSILISTHELIKEKNIKEPLNCKIFEIKNGLDEIKGKVLCKPVHFSSENCLIIIHTNSATGHPRGAMISHQGLLNQALQSALTWNLNSDDVNICALPLFHIAGINILLACQIVGGQSKILAKFDPLKILKIIEYDKGSVIGTFPPMLSNLIDEAEKTETLFSSLRVVMGLDSQNVIHKLQIRFPVATFWSTYGQTESSGSITLSPFNKNPGSAGQELPCVQIKIADEDGEILSENEVGEIIIRGPIVFLGYWGLEIESKRTLRDGWLHSGDLGSIDQNGFLWFKGRMPEKYLIKTGGENVYPSEVEKVILSHPSISEVAVIGVHDDKWGEAVVAICILTEGSKLSERDLITYVGNKIAKYKQPKFVKFTKEIPKYNNGSVNIPLLYEIFKL